MRLMFRSTLQMHQIKQAHRGIPGLGVLPLFAPNTVSVKILFPLFAASCLQSAVEVECKTEEGQRRHRQLPLSTPFLPLKGKTRGTLKSRWASAPDCQRYPPSGPSKGQICSWQQRSPGFEKGLCAPPGLAAPRAAPAAQRRTVPPASAAAAQQLRGKRPGSALPGALARL